MLQKVKKFNFILVLEEARKFKWNQATLEHMSLVHQDLNGCVEEMSALNIIQNQFILAELKSRRLAFACRIEAYQHLDGES